MMEEYTEDKSHLEVQEHVLSYVREMHLYYF